MPVTAEKKSERKAETNSKHKFARRHSCPTLDYRKLFSSQKAGGCDTKVGEKTSTNDVTTSVTMFDLQYPIPTLSARLSPQDGCSVRLQSASLKLPLKNFQKPEVQHSTDMRSAREREYPDVLGFARAKTSLPVSDWTNSEFKDKTTVTQLGFPKNEAEIVDFRRRRSSVPGTLGPDRYGTGFSASGAAMIKVGGQGHHRRKSTTSTSESVDRELRSLYKNSVEERRLHRAVVELDRQSFAGTLEHRHRTNQVFRDYRKLVTRSPRADDWLMMQKSRTSTLQERQRDDIDRRYSRRARHFRAPPYLQEMVAKIRSHAMFKAGLLHHADTEVENSSPSEEELEETADKLASLRMSRRHSVSGDEINSLPRISATPVPVSGALIEGRRVSMSDIKLLKDILEFRTRVGKSYIDKSPCEQDLADLQSMLDEEEDGREVSPDRGNGDRFYISDASTELMNDETSDDTDERHNRPTSSSRGVDEDNHHDDENAHVHCDKATAMSQILVF